MPNPKIDMLLLSMDLAYNRQSWHGPNLSGALRGWTPKTALKRPLRRRCAWEQLLHAAYWKQRVLNLLTETQPFPRAGSNWIKPPAKPTARAWRDDVALLDDIYKRLRKVVSGLDPGKLNERTCGLIIGGAFHDIYHAGQINLLKRMVRS